MIKVKKSDTHPFCIAYTHPSMGTTVCCKKSAHLVLSNLPTWLVKTGVTTYPVCRDHIGRVLINLGDAVDDIRMDIIVPDKD